MSRHEPFRWISSSRCDVGMVREVNEDACLDRPEAGLWVVADGMGGHTAGDMASGMIVESLREVEPAERLSTYVEQVEQRLLSVNDRLRRMAISQEAHTIGSTVAALLAHGRHGACIWAGDSRIYRLRDGVMQKVTQDHALVEELVERGVLTREQALRHPQANLVTRAVGATDNLCLDVEIFELCDGDRFVLCSDGLDKEVEDHEIAEVLIRDNDAPVSTVLVDIALSRGCRDNITVITVDIAAGDPLVESESEETVPRFGAQDE